MAFALLLASAIVRDYPVTNEFAGDSVLTNRIEKLSAWLVLATGWPRYLSAFAAGLVSALAMAPFDLFPVLFVTLPVFVWLIDAAHADIRTGFFSQSFKAFAIGWWFGFGYFLAGLWWIGNALLVEAEDFAWALPLAVLVLPAMLAFFWGGAAMLARWLWRENWSRIIILSASLALFEYLRGTMFTGFPWNTLGYAAMTFPVTMQSASLLGLYGVTLLAIFVFATPLVIIADQVSNAGGGRFMLLLAASLAIAHAGYGVFRLVQNPAEFVVDVKLRLMQPNISQSDKFNPEMESGILATYIETSQGENGLDGITHLLWPESAFPYLLTERSDTLSAIASLLPEGTQLVTGAARAEPGTAGNPYGRVYNSVYTIDSSGEITAAADKVHLVPFGEYLPFQETLEVFGFEQLTRVRGGFEPGGQRQLLNAGPAGKFLPLICYEIIFPGEVRNGPVDEDETSPGWIVNVTNDAWYGHTPGPYQHLRQSVIRGVEEGLPVVRVANSGISSVTDAFGRTVGYLGLGERGVVDSALPTVSRTTLFARHGNMIFFILCGFAFLLGITRAIIGRG